MSAQIVLSEPPAPVERAAADRPFRIRYRGSNTGDESTTGHWDHVAILDRMGSVQYEDWHKEGPLEPGAGYEALVDVGIALEVGSYLVWVTLDGGGETPMRRAEPLAIGSARSSSTPARHRIEIDEPPAPLEQVRSGDPFRVFYTATNAGPMASTGHYDRLVVTGAADVWEGWHAVGPLDPGDRYDAVVDVPALAAGGYRLEWTLDWAANHPMAAAGSADRAVDRAAPFRSATDANRGETTFSITPNAH